MLQNDRPGRQLIIHSAHHTTPRHIHTHTHTTHMHNSVCACVRLIQVNAGVDNWATFTTCYLPRGYHMKLIDQQQVCPAPPAFTCDYIRVRQANHLQHSSYSQHLQVTWFILIWFLATKSERLYIKFSKTLVFPQTLITSSKIIRFSRGLFFMIF